MLLALAFEESFATLAVDPPLQAMELLHCRFVDLLELVMRGGRLVQDAAQFLCSTLRLDNSTLTLDGFLESRRQKSAALGEIVGKSVGVIHNVRCCSDSGDERKSG